MMQTFQEDKVMPLKTSLRARYELILKTITELDERIQKLPEGRIIVKHHKTSTFYEHYQNDSVHYLNKNNAQTVKDLSQKHYLKKVLKAANQEAEALERALKLFPEITIEDIYDSLPEELRINTKPIVIGDDQYINKWLEAPYQRKPFKKDDPEYYSLKGDRVRSKSEIIIADRLYAKGIPYKYECPLKIGKKIIHPDFSILRMSDRQIVYHEHCGMIDKEDYARDMVKRVKLYSTAKIYQGDRLFFTFETSDDSIDVNMIDDFIEKNYR